MAQDALALTGYTDESGNSGNHLFDNHQPMFWTCTVLTPNDLDVVGVKPFRRWRERTGYEELHGNSLGVARLEIIAAEVAQFLAEQDCHVIFTIVEKRHVARLKFADTVLDSGINLAVSPVSYTQRHSRLILAGALAEMLGSEREERFWQVFQAEDAAGFADIVLAVLQDVKIHTRDARLRQLLSDALEWASQHPDLLLTKQTLLDSPNIVALTLLNQAIKDIFEGRHVVVERFIHDTQTQYAKYLAQAHDFMKRISFPSGSFSFATDIHFVDVIRCSIEMADSNDTLGLQLADVILWLMKRWMERGPIEAPNISLLIQQVLKQGSFTALSMGQMYADVQSANQTLMNRPMTPQDEQRAREWIEKFERQRLERMMSGPKNDPTARC